MKASCELNVLIAKEIMVVKILVKTKGKHKSVTAVHLYDAENDCALCRSWPKPGGDWEVQEVENFSGGVGYSNHYACWHCKAKLKALSKPKLPKEPRKPTRHEKELEAWKRWTGRVHETIEASPVQQGERKT